MQRLTESAQPPPPIPGICMGSPFHTFVPMESLSDFEKELEVRNPGNDLAMLPYLSSAGMDWPTCSVLELQRTHEVPVSG
jgi:hypothetical protein